MNHLRLLHVQGSSSSSTSRRSLRGLAAGIATAALLLGACASPDGQRTASTDETSATGTAQTEQNRVAAGQPDESSFPKLPSALPDTEGEKSVPAPVSITIESLNIDRAPIGGVGIEPNGELEVPPPKEVGWYSYGVEPGAEGSSVLAAHIASEGIDGVFRFLDQIRPGDVVTISFEDPKEPVSFTVTRTEQYNKSELPFDDVFRRAGEPQLVLITCGGDFNSSVDSYEDNVVAYATPVS